MRSLCQILSIIYVFFTAHSVSAGWGDDDDEWDNNDDWDDFEDRFDDFHDKIKTIGIIIFGAFIVFVVVIVVCCCFCPACMLYKRRTSGRVIRQDNDVVFSNVTMNQLPAQAGYNQQQPVASQPQFPVAPQGQAYPKQYTPYNPTPPANASSYPPQMGYLPTGASVPYPDQPPPYPGLPDQYNAQNNPTIHPSNYTVSMNTVPGTQDSSK